LTYYRALDKLSEFRLHVVIPAPNLMFLSSYEEGIEPVQKHWCLLFWWPLMSKM